MIEVGAGNVESGREKEPGGIVRLALTGGLLGHLYGIDNMDYTVGLEDVGVGHQCGDALFIFQDDAIAIL